MGVTAPQGFVAAGVPCGIKPSGDPDLALVATADGRPVAAAGVFTANKATAAPVLTSADHLAATGARGLSFTPVLAPMPRGILATVTARPVGRVTAAQAGEALVAAYAGEPFVHVLPEGRWPHTGATLGSNSCHLQATVDADTGRIIVVSALDNLGKGAAGQAVQCANLMLGLPETAGLSSHGVAP